MSAYIDLDTADVAFSACVRIEAILKGKEKVERARLCFLKCEIMRRLAAGDWSRCQEGPTSDASMVEADSSSDVLIPSIAGFDAQQTVMASQCVQRLEAAVQIGEEGIALLRAKRGTHSSDTVVDSSPSLPAFSEAEHLWVSLVLLCASCVINIADIKRASSMKEVFNVVYTPSFDTLQLSVEAMELLCSVRDVLTVRMRSSKYGKKAAKFDHYGEHNLAKFAEDYPELVTEVCRASAEVFELMCSPLSARECRLMQCVNMCRFADAGHPRVFRSLLRNVYEQLAKSYICNAAMSGGMDRVRRVTSLCSEKLAPCDVELALDRALFCFYFGLVYYHPESGVGASRAELERLKELQPFATNSTVVGGGRNGNESSIEDLVSELEVTLNDRDRAYAAIVKQVDELGDVMENVVKENMEIVGPFLKRISVACWDNMVASPIRALWDKVCCACTQLVANDRDLCCTFGRALVSPWVFCARTCCACGDYDTLCLSCGRILSVCLEPATFCGILKATADAVRLVNPGSALACFLYVACIGMCHRFLRRNRDVTCEEADASRILILDEPLRVGSDATRILKENARCAFGELRDALAWAVCAPFGSVIAEVSRDRGTVQEDVLVVNVDAIHVMLSTEKRRYDEQISEAIARLVAVDTTRTALVGRRFGGSALSAKSILFSSSQLLSECEIEVDSSWCTFGMAQGSHGRASMEGDNVHDGWSTDADSTEDDDLGRVGGMDAENTDADMIVSDKRGVSIQWDPRCVDSSSDEEGCVHGDEVVARKQRRKGGSVLSHVTKRDGPRRTVKSPRKRTKRSGGSGDVGIGEVGGSDYGVVIGERESRFLTWKALVSRASVPAFMEAPQHVGARDHDDDSSEDILVSRNIRSDGRAKRAAMGGKGPEGRVIDVAVQSYRRAGGLERQWSTVAAPPSIGVGHGEVGTSHLAFRNSSREDSCGDRDEHDASDEEGTDPVASRAGSGSRVRGDVSSGRGVQSHENTRRRRTVPTSVQRKQKAQGPLSPASRNGLLPFSWKAISKGFIAVGDEGPTGRRAEGGDGSGRASRARRPARATPGGDHVESSRSSDAWLSLLDEAHDGERVIERSVDVQPVVSVWEVRQRLRDALSGARAYGIQILRIRSVPGALFVCPCTGGIGTHMAVLRRLIPKARASRVFEYTFVNSLCSDSYPDVAKQTVVVTREEFAADKLTGLGEVDISFFRDLGIPLVDSHSRMHSDLTRREIGDLFCGVGVLSETRLIRNECVTVFGAVWGLHRNFVVWMEEQENMIACAAGEDKKKLLVSYCRTCGDRIAVIAALVQEVAGFLVLDKCVVAGDVGIVTVSFFIGIVCRLCLLRWVSRIDETLRDHATSYRDVVAVLQQRVWSIVFDVWLDVLCCCVAASSSGCDLNVRQVHTKGWVLADECERCLSGAIDTCAFFGMCVCALVQELAIALCLTSPPLALDGSGGGSVFVQCLLTWWEAVSVCANSNNGAAFLIDALAVGMPLSSWAQHAVQSHDSGTLGGPFDVYGEKEKVMHKFFSKALLSSACSVVGQCTMFFPAPIRKSDCNMGSAMETDALRATLCHGVHDARSLTWSWNTLFAFDAVLSPSWLCTLCLSLLCELIGLCANEDICRIDSTQHAPYASDASEVIERLQAVAERATAAGYCCSTIAGASTVQRSGSTKSFVEAVLRGSLHSLIFASMCCLGRGKQRRWWKSVVTRRLPESMRVAQGCMSDDDWYSLLASISSWTRRWMVLCTSLSFRGLWAGLGKVDPFEALVFACQTLVAVGSVANDGNQCVLTDSLRDCCRTVVSTQVWPVDTQVDRIIIYVDKCSTVLSRVVRQLRQSDSKDNPVPSELGEVLQSVFNRSVGFITLTLSDADQAELVWCMVRFFSTAAELSTFCRLGVEAPPASTQGLGMMSIPAWMGSTALARSVSWRKVSVLIARYLHLTCRLCDVWQGKGSMNLMVGLMAGAFLPTVVAIRTLPSTVSGVFQFDSVSRIASLMGPEWDVTSIASSFGTSGWLPCIQNPMVYGVLRAGFTRLVKLELISIFELFDLMHQVTLAGFSVNALSVTERMAFRYRILGGMGSAPIALILDVCLAVLSAPSISPCSTSTARLDVVWCAVCAYIILVSAGDRHVSVLDCDGPASCGAALRSKDVCDWATWDTSFKHVCDGSEDGCRAMVGVDAPEGRMSMAQSAGWEGRCLIRLWRFWTADFVHAIVQTTEWEHMMIATCWSADRTFEEFLMTMSGDSQCMLLCVIICCQMESRSECPDGIASLQQSADGTRGRVSDLIDAFRNGGRVMSRWPSPSKQGLASRGRFAFVQRCLGQLELLRALLPRMMHLPRSSRYSDILQVVKQFVGGSCTHLGEEIRAGVCHPVEVVASPDVTLVRIPSLEAAMTASAYLAASYYASSFDDCGALLEGMRRKDVTAPDSARTMLLSVLGACKSVMCSFGLLRRISSPLYDLYLSYSEKSDTKPTAAMRRAALSMVAAVLGDDVESESPQDTLSCTDDLNAAGATRKGGRGLGSTWADMLPHVLADFDRRRMVDLCVQWIALNWDDGVQASRCVLAGRLFGLAASGRLGGANSNGRLTLANCVKVSAIPCAPQRWCLRLAALFDDSLCVGYDAEDELEEPWLADIVWRRNRLRVARKAHHILEAAKHVCLVKQCRDLESEYIVHGHDQPVDAASPLWLAVCTAYTLASPLDMQRLFSKSCHAFDVAVPLQYFSICCLGPAVAALRDLRFVSATVSPDSVPAVVERSQRGMAISSVFLCWLGAFMLPSSCVMPFLKEKYPVVRVPGAERGAVMGALGFAVPCAFDGAGDRKAAIFVKVVTFWERAGSCLWAKWSVLQGRMLLSATTSMLWNFELICASFEEVVTTVKAEVDAESSMAALRGIVVVRAVVSLFSAALSFLVTYYFVILSLIAKEWCMMAGVVSCIREMALALLLEHKNGGGSAYAFLDTSSSGSGVQSSMMAMCELVLDVRRQVESAGRVGQKLYKMLQRTVGSISDVVTLPATVASDCTNALNTVYGQAKHLRVTTRCVSAIMWSLSVDLSYACANVHFSDETDSGVVRNMWSLDSIQTIVQALYDHVNLNTTPEDSAAGPTRSLQIWNIASGSRNGGKMPSCIPPALLTTVEAGEYESMMEPIYRAISAQAMRIATTELEMVGAHSQLHARHAARALTWGYTLAAYLDDCGSDTQQKSSHDVVSACIPTDSPKYAVLLEAMLTQARHGGQHAAACRAPSSLLAQLVAGVFLHTKRLLRMSSQHITYTLDGANKPGDDRNEGTGQEQGEAVRMAARLHPLQQGFAAVAQASRRRGHAAGGRATSAAARHASSDDLLALTAYCSAADDALDAISRKVKPRAR